MELLDRTASICSEYIFPAGCCLCGSMLTKTGEMLNSLCEDCGQSIQMEEAERCRLCGRPLISENGTCLGCREDLPDEEEPEQENSENKGPAYDRLISLFPYTGKYRELLWAFKYGKSQGAARFLSDRLLEALELFEAENPVLVPVPPRPGKIRKTGWDQIKCLEGMIRKKNRYKVFPCLKRLAQDKQKTLSREERKHNLEGKIRFAAGTGKAPRTCVLFDDVITTGSTMNACAAALKAAGAEKVYGICLVYD